MSSRVRSAQRAAAAACLLVTLVCGSAQAITPPLPAPTPAPSPGVTAVVPEPVGHQAQELVAQPVPKVLSQQAQGVLDDTPPSPPTLWPSSPAPTAGSSEPSPAAARSAPQTVAAPPPEITPPATTTGDPRPAGADRPTPRPGHGRGAAPSSRTGSPLGPSAAGVPSGLRPSEAERPDDAPPDKHEASSPLPVLADIWESMPALVRTLIAAVGACMALLGLLWLLAAFRAGRLARSRAEVLQDAALLQQALLPNVPDRIGQVLLSGAYRSADGPGAGGDFYDVFALGEMVAVIVGDASGHGRAALRRATLTHYTLRAYLEAGLPPRAVLELAGRVRTGEDDGEFATAVVALYDPAQETLTYACAGHPPPLVQGPGLDDCAVTACSPPPLGGFGVPTGQRQTTLRIPAGGVACLFTDGVVEARIGADLFGRDRLAELVGRLGPEATARELVDTVRAQTDSAPDDMAACLIRPLMESSAAPLRVEELEVTSGPTSSAERFLEACGTTADQALSFGSKAQEAARRDGRARLQVTVSPEGTDVEVLTDVAQARLAA